MFVSPLGRILMVLTLLAFAGAVAWLEDRNGMICAATTGAALILLAVTVGKLVIDGSIFDDRGFHRTRPGGERMALRRLNRILAGLVIAIAAMPAVRCWIYNLGWESATWAAVLALVPAAWFTTAVATGVILSLQGRFSVRTVILVLVGIPVGMVLVTMVVPYLRRWIVSAFFVKWYGIPVWTDTLIWAFVIGAAGCFVSWWLASQRRRGKAALLIAGLTGIQAQLLVTKLPLVPTRDLPPADVKIDRLPARNSDSAARSLRPRFKEEWGVKDPEIEGSVQVEGLGENEFVAFDLMIHSLASLRARYALPSGVLGRGQGADLLKDDQSFTLKSDRGSLIDHLAEELPGRPKLESREGRPSAVLWTSLPNPVDQTQLGNSTWTIDGVLCRVDRLGSFPVRARSSYRLDGGGMVRTWDLLLTRYETSLGFRLIQPDPPFVPVRTQDVPDGGFVNPPPNFIWGIMINENGTKALMVLDGTYRPDREQAFGSCWSDFWLNLRYLGNPGGWTEEEVLRSTIHLFASRQVAKVHASLPPP